MRNFRVVVIGGGTGTFVGLRGHNLGNLILTGLRDLYGSEPKALEKAVSIFKISGRVLPVSLQKTTLVAVYEDGKRLAGEHEIDQPLDFVLLSSSKIPRRIEEAYRQEKDTVPLDDLQGLSPSRVIRADLARRRLIPRLSGDSLVRSFFRHDEDKLARALIKILL